jgi:hypothetical protein
LKRYPPKMPVTAISCLRHVDKEMRTPERFWEGEVVKITRRADKVWLQFRLGRVTTCPENFAGSPDGWYTDGTAQATSDGGQ